MTIGLIPGSFDPPTLGHLDVIERASHFCKALTVGIAANPSKKTCFFELEERLSLLEKVVGKRGNLSLVIIEGLVADYARDHGIDILIRGLRGPHDLEHEFQMAAANKKLYETLETLFLMADPRYAHISSSLLKEIASLGHHLRDFVPAEIEKDVRERLASA